jgi:hypothetical protein
MPSHIQVVFNYGIGGGRAKLTVRVGGVEDVAIPPHSTAASAISYASEWVRRTLGIDAPGPLFSWSLEPPIEIKGFSCFGSFAASLMQECVREGLGCANRMSPGTRVLLTTIRAACLDDIAISAARDSADGRFGQVGEIEEKLRSLVTSGIRDPACVLAWDQEMPIWEKWNGNEWVKSSGALAEPYERWRESKWARPISIIPAHDALDAIARVFELQRNHVARNVLPFVKASVK